MSLTIWFTAVRPTEVWDGNITHNLASMAGDAGVYEYLWRAEENGYTAEQIIEPLERGLALLKSDPERFKAFNAKNGWGLYEHLVEFVQAALDAAKENPDAEISVWR